MRVYVFVRAVLWGVTSNHIYKSRPCPREPVFSENFIQRCFFTFLNGRYLMLHPSRLRCSPPPLPCNMNKNYSRAGAVLPMVPLATTGLQLPWNPMGIDTVRSTQTGPAARHFASRIVSSLHRFSPS